MRKLVILNLLIILALSFSSCKEKEYVRLRIIAEDNSESSLNQKNIIKETLKELYEDNIISYENLNVNTVTNYLNLKLEKELFNQLKISNTVSYYPAKTFDGKMIPSGNYETLLIEIGNAKGNNFWTLLYPEYYGFEFEETNEIEYRSYFYDLFS